MGDMDISDSYDYVILGTGLTESALSGYLGSQGKRIIHIEKSSQYGADAASVNIETLWRMLEPVPAGEQPWVEWMHPTKEQRSELTEEKIRHWVNKWNIDLLPKFLMADGVLTKIIVATNLYPNYVQFGPVEGSYVYKNEGQAGRVSKVPSTAVEAMSSDLMGFFEKRRAKAFLDFVGTYQDDAPPGAPENLFRGLDLSKCTMKDLYEKAGLESATRDFIGHSLALYTSEDYLTQPGLPMEAIQRIRLYVNSMSKFGNSPYIYPRYGIGDLPQSFCRLSAVHGGTFLLETDVDEVMYEDGKVSGIKATWHTPNGDMKFSTKTSAIIAEPSYFESRVKPVEERGKPLRLLRTVCILDHPIAHPSLKPKEKESTPSTLQLIIPYSQCGRRHDIYVAVFSSQLGVCPEPYYIAFVSTIAERDISASDPNFDAELQPGYKVLGSIKKKFKFPPKPLFEPVDNGTSDRIFMTKTYDPATHWESTVADIMDIYSRAEGKELKIEQSTPDANSQP
ncbi:MAG: Rab GDP dissociation inhibitor beta [Alyxoria varia]|nr:MAG: Rab GDP dissociation inhibitor beta [Alyxoria varia]